MSETPQTPEAIAYALMEGIFRCEGKMMGIPARDSGSGKAAATRKDILDTFKECLIAVRHP